MITILIEYTGVLAEQKGMDTQRSILSIVDSGDIIVAADDFEVPEGQVWEIDRTVGYGRNDGDLTGFSAGIEIYRDNDGVPGELIYSDMEDSEFLRGTIDVNLAEAISLESGKYWISIRCITDSVNPELNSWLWGSETNKVGAESQYKFLTDDWIPTREFWGLEGPIDHKFTLHGSIVNLPNDTAKNSEASLKEKLTLDIYPNPSTTSFVIPLRDFEDSKGAVIKVLDLTGRVIFQDIVTDRVDRYVWNAAEQKPGLYVISVRSNNKDLSFKVLKN